MAGNDSVSQPGGGRCPGPGWQQILAEDSNPVPGALREEHYQYLGSEAIASSRYVSPDFFARENQMMWPRVWQFAAREEDLLESGDFVIYENVGKSYLLSRQPDGSVKALHNVCLHRGRKLRTESGNAESFQCPFHGFTWNADGSLREIPCRWDFSHLTDAKMHLPEAEVARWGGYIFLREQPGGPTLEEYLSPLQDHFQRWKHEECTTSIWVGKVVDANWKVVAEAFMESFHTLATHPQLLPFTGDCNASYNNWGDNISANFVPFGTMSPHVSSGDKPQQWIVDEFVKYNGRSADNYDAAGDSYNVIVPEGRSARHALGDSLRESSSKMFGRDHSHASDAEMMDALVYNVFPNFAPWGGFMPNIVYRWRPWRDQDHCLMDVRILTRVVPGEPIPPSVPMNFLSAEQKWTDAPELGVLGAVFEQDMDNLPYVQEGLKASANGEVQLADYQEIRIRQFHQTLDKYLATGSEEK